MIYDIVSASNQKYKHIKSLSQKKTRQKSREYIVEGIKSVQDALNSDRTVLSLSVCESFYTENTFDYPTDTDIFKFPDKLFYTLCDTENPQGILAVIKMDDQKPIHLDKSRLYIYCDHVNDPGNLGTILRTADAVNAGGVFLSDGTVDLYSPKVIRSTMGSYFHIKVYENVTLSMLADIKNDGFNIICGALSENAVSHTQCDMTKPTILVVGNEANGVSREILNLSSQCVKIPILGGAESLNVAVAAAVLMYEAVRQRGLC